MAYSVWKKSLFTLAFSFTLLLSSTAYGEIPSGCSDLSAIPVSRNIDFERDIQPIFSQCAACHGENGRSGLDLRPGAAYGNLVGIESVTWPDRLRVEPLNPSMSVLLSAINCADPYRPRFQMGSTSVAERALIRDWIAGGARLQAQAYAVPIANPVGQLLMLLVVFLSGLLIINSRNT